MRGDTQPLAIATLEPSVSFLGGKLPPYGRWRPRGAHLRDGERVKVMPSEPGGALTDQRPSPAIAAEPEELLPQEPGSEQPESGHSQERSRGNPMCHVL